jgi:hypothetical protein
MFPIELKGDKVLVHGPGGEIGEMTSFREKATIKKFKKPCKPNCGGPFNYVVHAFNSIVPIGEISNQLPCMVGVYHPGGQYLLTNARFLKGGSK